MDDADSDRQQSEIRAVVLPVAILGFLGFATALIGAAVVNIRDNDPQMAAAPPASQPTTGQNQQQAPAAAPSRKTTPPEKGPAQPGK